MQKYEKTTLEQMDGSLMGAGYRGQGAGYLHIIYTQSKYSQEDPQ